MDNSEEILSAIKNNDLEIIRKIDDINNLLFNKKRTLLMIAVIHDKIDIVNFLLSKGSNIDIQDENGSTALHFACNNGNMELVKILVTNGANINIDDNYNSTPLHFAILRNEDIFKYLVENGADINKMTKLKTTPVHFAVFMNKLGIVKYLVQTKGVSINFKDMSGDTLLHLAVRTKNLEMVKFFVEKGHATDIVNIIKQNPIDIAEQEILKLIKRIEEGEKVEEVEIKATIDIYEYLKKDINGDTLLHLAVRIKNLEMIKFFVEKGYDVNIKNNKGKTPIELTNNKKIIELLSKKNHNVGNKYLEFLNKVISKNDYDKGIIMCKSVFEKLTSEEKKYITSELLLTAVSINNREYVKFLINEGADVNYKDDLGRTPLMHAVMKKNINIIRFFTTKDTSKINESDCNGDTALIYAFKLNNNEIIEELLLWNADFEIKNNKNDTTLTISATHSNLYLFDYLSIDSFNSIINNQNIDGDTALIIASRKGHKDFLKTLLTSSVINLNIQNKDGYTALMYASEKNNEEIIKILIFKGADVNIKNNKGKTAIKLTNNEKIKNLIDKKNHNVLSDLLELEIFKPEEIIEYIGEEVNDDDVKKKKRKKKPNKNKKTSTEEEKKIEVKDEEKISIEQENINSILNEIKLEKSYKIIYSDCSTDLCGTLAITCFIKHGSNFIEMIGAHGLWEKLDDTYTNNKGVIKTYKKPIINVRSPDTTEKYDSLFLYKNSDNKTFPCISVEREKFNPEFIEHEWEKHGKKFDNYTNYKDYFNEICRLSKPILNLLFLEKNMKKIKENRDCTFDDYVNSILVSEYRKYLYNIKDTDDYKEFHFSVCKKDGIWNFCVNDDKKHY